MAARKVAQAPKSNQQQLGTLLAAVLEHPDLPEKVYDGIVDGLNELQTREVSKRPEFIQALIDGHNLEEKKGTVKAEGGGA